MIDEELRAYVESRRSQVQAARATAVHQNGEWAADGALHELDRLVGWLNLRRQRDLVHQRLHKAAAGAFVAEPER